MSLTVWNCERVNPNPSAEQSDDTIGIRIKRVANTCAIIKEGCSTSATQGYESFRRAPNRNRFSGTSQDILETTRATKGGRGTTAYDTLRRQEYAPKQKEPSTTRRRSGKLRPESPRARSGATDFCSQDSYGVSKTPMMSDSLPASALAHSPVWNNLKGFSK